MNDRIHVLAKAELQRTDWKLLRALERAIAGQEWCDWRDEVRRLVRDNEGVTELPPEPPFGVGTGLIERIEVPGPERIEVPGPERVVTVTDTAAVEAAEARARAAEEELERLRAAAAESVPVGNSLPETDPDAVPAELEPFRHEGETPEEFRKRMNWILFRFGMSEGDYTPDMPRLTNEEKIALYPLIEANARANDWLKFKT